MRTAHSRGTTRAAIVGGAILAATVFGSALPLAVTVFGSALPLFATGGDGLGLLGWRRKRAQAVA
jgi:hypothetical protein